MQRFSASHRCVTYSQRGYPPSDVPEDGADKYSQDIARDDSTVSAVMDALKVDEGAHRRRTRWSSLTALHVGILTSSSAAFSMHCCRLRLADRARTRKIVEDTQCGIARDRQDVCLATDIRSARSAISADGPTRQAHKNKGSARLRRNSRRCLANIRQHGHALDHDQSCRPSGRHCGTSEADLKRFSVPLLDHCRRARDEPGASTAAFS